MITVHTLATDGHHAAHQCDTLERARLFAQYAVGATPEIGGGYAIAPDGVVRVTVEGCPLADLFSVRVIPQPVHVAGYNVRFHDGRLSDTSWQVLVDHLYPRGPNHATREAALAWAQAQFPGQDIGDDGHVRTIWAD